ncbi:MarR family winged helix-turn-helix transcriptional regulator [Isoptericola dokdonensis]|jgi:DNA-binding MarR family transcriptional regulator|uniref:MarR family protein n=1 Tax=Isoptericola dokdonensis DS-3 TaxID=1300344 RepID=A0A168FEP7_9MICO|nr:MarR family winged helix-turn-helix transcriptional regulator [Isoptericola dokdonensis]ANC31536.1 MarR family protein [Isoptericola dokdonensis DS-3]
MTDPGRTLISALQALGRAQRDAAAHLAESLGCPRAGLGIVLLLDGRGTLPLCEVAEILKVDSSVASRQVSALVDAGLVRRTVDDHDRRARTLELTADGRALAADAGRSFDRLVSVGFADWDETDLLHAAHQIRSVADAITSVPREELVR